jgi:hypothetical protein
MSVATILKRLSIATVGATTIAFTTAYSASAASIGFNFSGTDGQQGLISFDEDGLNVEATGKIANGDPRDVFQDEDGLGVFAGGTENQQIDGVGVEFRETLSLEFNKLVTLLSATFTKVDSDGDGDEFKLLVDGNQLVSDTPIPSDGTFDFTSTSYDATGTVLGFTVGDSDDDYFLKSVEVKEVPEPTTILGSLLVTGFGAMFYKKRKNQSDIAA